jgi:anti-sigma-K factor RskA
MSTPVSGEDDPRDVAAEYVLGLLETEEARLVAAQIDLDPELKSQVIRWQESFAPLADAVPPVEPPARLKGVIERKIYGVPVTKAGYSFLRFLTVGGAVAVLTLAVLWFVLSRDAGDFSATLADAGRGLRVEAVFDADTATLEVARVSGPEEPGRSVELWLLAADSPTPVSLGLVPESGATSVTLTPELAARFGTAKLAISDEPEGGSPTGQPTGAVLAVADVQAI